MRLNSQYAILQTSSTWQCKDMLLSKVTPRVLTDIENSIASPSTSIEVGGSDKVILGFEANIASVLPAFRLSLFDTIQERDAEMQFSRLEILLLTSFSSL